VTQWLGRLERFGKAAEDTLLVTMLAAMMLLATAQIIGRNLIGQSFILGDEALRLLVLWLTLAGAIAASRADRAAA
jgi:TRAP-type C4-dicarboxylate transport system permease small subunit